MKNRTTRKICFAVTLIAAILYLVNCRHPTASDQNVFLVGVLAPKPAL